ncbi:hypothetical protein RhiirA4_466516 [Rhizophagus irregularis]|uniref:Uncharacterized protein n=1 Tax=Rhizophagus irregularis TaxID=588596 RepID=A0A2I1GU81_9GLOM|nr:hypothetical protein RhiirA4_466516 [Rhizophagus irregularis]
MFLENENVIVFDRSQRLSFNYVSFCKYIIDLKLEIRYRFQHKPELLYQELLKLFISECTSIKHLDICSLDYPIHDFPGASNCFSNLRELICTTKQSASHLYGLGQICRLIEIINIDLTCANSGLAELIKMQKQIKHVILNIKYDCEMIIHALEKHIHSILHIRLCKFNDSFSPIYVLLPKLVNLQSFEFNNYGDCQTLEKYLMNGFYFNLQVLDLHHVSLFIAKNIIQNTDNKLWKIKIRASDYDHSIEYNQAICNCCPNIKYVTVFLNNNLDNLKNLLVNCQRLEALDVIVQEKEDNFLDLLVKLAPVSLYKIHINREYFTIESINSFFSNWGDRKTLHLYDHNSDWRRFVKSNKTEGVIGHEYCYGFWDYE